MAEEHNEHQLPLEELMKIRRAKLEDLYKQGINPYGERFERTHLAREIIDHFDQLAETETRIAGRIMSFRTHGKTPWLADEQIQLHPGGSSWRSKNMNILQADIGDVVAVMAAFGPPANQRRVYASDDGQVAAASANKWYGLKDVEIRYGSATSI